MFTGDISYLSLNPQCQTLKRLHAANMNANIYHITLVIFIIKQSRKKLIIFSQWQHLQKGLLWWSF